MEQFQQPQIDLANTTMVKGHNEGVLFGQATILRKVSKFITGGTEDALLPIPVFYDMETKKIIADTLPPELREEYKDYILDI